MALPRSQLEEALPGDDLPLVAASRAMTAWSGMGSVGHHARRPRTDWCLGRAHPAQLQDSDMKKVMIHDALELRICSMGINEHRFLAERLPNRKGAKDHATEVQGHNCTFCLH
jgi:hypothetical protein